MQDILQHIFHNPVWSQAIAAWVTNIIALLGLIVTLIVAIYARKAYYEAKRQADAANKSFLQAKRQADASDKAWLAFEGISLIVVSHSPNPNDQTHTSSYKADFQIANYGKVPARVLFVGVELIAPVTPGHGEQPFDKNGNISPDYVKTGDNGEMNYELADKMIPADHSQPIKTQYNQSILTYTRSVPPQRDHRTLFLWLKVRYSDQGSEGREMASLFKIPESGRLRLMTENKAYTYLREISST